MIHLLLLTTLASGAPVLGLEWVPYSRGDMAWVQEGHLSGTGVGEFDGLLRPAATFQAGWGWGRNAVLAGVGVARFATVTWSGDNYQRYTVGAVRPSLAWRRHLGDPDRGKMTPWLDGGLYAAIPMASIESDSFTDEEQAAADEEASVLRKGIGGMGLRIGPGFAWDFGGIAVGARYHVVLHRAQAMEETGLIISTMLYAEAALVLEARL